MKGELMAEEQKFRIPMVKLRNQGFQVSKLGFGCMRLTGINNIPLYVDVGISIVEDAFTKGITFLDSADVYGPHTNKVLLGKSLKQLPREKIRIATKFGIAGTRPTGVLVKGTPEYVRSCCEASLKHLDAK
ncbi:hypothetical protein C5167_017369 [Papaver somniferum]|uniref:NADP-dependent oxidoreductase domain-containing protein n=1 Tax=Papaver somniferum TaxID=3469 RepID=A0A4Y7IMC6_PAPSO|nr:hypothetical protein C5167_017369 [Papaver somniferum]